LSSGLRIPSCFNRPDIGQIKQSILKTLKHFTTIKAFLLILILLSLAFTQTRQHDTKTASLTCASADQTIYPFLVQEPYELVFEIERSEDNTYRLVATIDFRNGSYTASPLTDRDLSGLFRMEVAPSNHIRLDDAIEENPPSIEIDNMPGKWIREKTTYKQILHISHDEDFQIGGKVTFTIEPRCTFEEIPFMIKYRSGVLTIEEWGC